MFAVPLYELLVAATLYKLMGAVPLYELLVAVTLYKLMVAVPCMNYWLR
jgi:hypothetical protein